MACRLVPCATRHHLLSEVSTGTSQVSPVAKKADTERPDHQVCMSVRLAMVLEASLGPFRAFVNRKKDLLLSFSDSVSR
jgi:hypothetical protein